MLNISGLVKRFGDFTAVDGLNLAIGEGVFYGFLGPNGAGKTTTIKMITGLFSPSAGEITVGGYDIQKAPMMAKAITGYVPDQPFLYEKLTGREFLQFNAGLYRIDRRTVSGRIAELSEILEIGSWIDRRTEHYSQGMRQRIAITAALLQEPKLLVIDEPMVGLDPRSTHIVKLLLKKKSQDGMTVFMSTHSLPIVEELCDAIGIIKSGRLVFDGSVAEFGRFKSKVDGKFESAFLELTK